MGSALTGLFCVPELSWTGKGGLFYTGDASLGLDASQHGESAYPSFSGLD